MPPGTALLAGSSIAVCVLLLLPAAAGSSYPECGSTHVDSNGALIIPSDWTEMPNRLAGCNLLRSVSFAGSSVTSVGYRAFVGCPNLVSVSFVDSNVTSVGESAFMHCHALSSVSFSGTRVTHLGRNAFWGCTSLVSVSFSNSRVAAVGDNTFRGCSSLQSVSFGNSHVASVGSAAFYDCAALESASFINSSVATLAESAFWDCGRLASVIYDSNRYPDVHTRAFVGDTGCGGTVYGPAANFRPPGICRCVPTLEENRGVCRLSFAVNQSSGRAQQERMQSHVAANVSSEFITGHTEIVPGFDLSFGVSLADLFENVRRGPNQRDLVAFSVVSDYAAGDPGFGNRSTNSLGDALFVSPSTGMMSLKMDNPGNHTVSLMASTGSGPAEQTQPVAVVSWTVQVRNPGTFGLRQDAPEGCGEQYMAELQDRITEKLRERAPRDDRHDVNTTVVLPGIDTDRCSFSDIFAHYGAATDDAGEPQISFGVVVEDPDTNATADLGEAPFYTDTGRVLLALNREGRFRVKLQAFTVRSDGRKTLDLTEMALDVRLPDTHDLGTREKRNCSGHGEVAEDVDAGGGPVRQNEEYRCICTDAWTGPDCETPPATAELTITGVTQVPEMTQTLGYTRYAGETAGEDQSVQPLSIPDRVLWAVGVRYRLPALNITTAGIDNSAVGFKLAPNPPGFFVNGETAETIGVPDSSSAFFGQPHTVTAYAVAEGFADTELGTITFEYRYADTDVNNPSFAVNGPRNRACENDATAVERDGASDFDSEYECDCAGGYSGPNCDTPPAAASAASAATDSGGVVGASLGAVVFVMLAALIAFRVQVYRLKHRPIDVGVTQDEVLASLGLAATTDIGAGEFGISLLFDAVIGHSADDWTQFKADLVAVLCKTAPQIKAALQQQQQQQQPAHRIIIDGLETSRVLVVMPKAMSAAPADDIARLLAAKARKGTLVIGAGRRHVVDASVAVPRRVPREIPRGALTRLKLLGEGAFGEVHQYQVEERGKSVAHFVAAKSIMAGAAGAVEARADLLREAALGALLEHRNVVYTIGVCTVPRDVPALLLLSFCAEGSLEKLAASASPATVGTSDRLTYCAQTLQGLQYIASIRIVHRDVAARNVLLDATMTCKVSDFGMATALQENGKEYVRGTDELAMRWAAPEVIAGGKFSAQSDAWAFGVLAYEVFACGVLPYADQFDNLTEISSFVKGGGKLGRPNPEACPAEVYEQLMLPCFAADPADRPTFGALYDVAVKHGAEEDDEAQAERATRRKHAHALWGKLSHNVNGAVYRSLLGPSVNHLKEVLVPGMLKAMDRKWNTTLTRAAADVLLKQAGIDGGFLVRPSATASSGRVLARYEEGTGIRNLDIEAEYGEFWVQKWHRRFGFVDELIAHYMSPGGDRKLGDRVAVNGYGCAGTVRFVGDHHTKGKRRIGVELDEPTGKNDGTVDGHEYFSCPPKRGVLLQPQKVTDIEVFESALVCIPGYECATAPMFSYASLLAGGDMAKASIWNMVHAYAKPAGEHTVCPRDGDMGCAYVDTLKDENDVGRADALLSYSWGYLVAEVSAALSAWADRTGRDPKKTYIWICSLCLNQHGFESRMQKAGGPCGPEALAKAFGDRVVALGRILPMLQPWHDPGYVKRAWCLFELFTSIQNRSEVEIDIILSPKDAQSFRDRINADGTDARAIDEALQHVHSENAEASVQADLDAIRALIQQYSGGFGTIDDTVRQYLRKWFVSQGGVKVVARRRKGSMSSSSAGDRANSTAAITASSSVERARPETTFTGFDPGSASGAADETTFGFDIPGSVSGAAEGDEEGLWGDDEYVEFG